MDKELKPKADEKLAPKGATGDGKPGASILFGIMFNYQSKDKKEEKRIIISISDIKKVSEEGFKFTLPEPIELGTFDDLCGWFDDKFKTTITDELKPDNLPSPLKDIVDKAEKMKFSISKCHIQMAGKKALNGEEVVGPPENWTDDNVKAAVLKWARENKGKFDTETVIPDEDKNDDAGIEKKDDKDEWLIFKKEPKILICRAKKEKDKDNKDILNIYKPTLYTFQVEVKLDEGIPLVESLEFDGFAFGVTNEQSKL